MPAQSSLPLNKRFISLIVTALCLLTLLSLLVPHGLSSSPSQQNARSSGSSSSSSGEKGSSSPVTSSNLPDKIDHGTLHGGVISSKIGNETVKAELGRAGWKLLHTTMAKFPDKPTEDEQTALLSYIHLFARLYPCGECASHFQQILSKYPPQVRTRSNAAAWACHVHNEVNKSLNKELFDCSNIGDFYDCGCADEEGDEHGGAGKQGGDNGEDPESDADKSGGGGRGGGGVKDKAGSGKAGGGDKIDLEVERNGPTQGG